MPDNPQVRRDFQRILAEQDNIGLGKIVSGWFFEPRHIFDPDRRRRLKPGIVIVFSYILLMAAAGLVFNLGGRP